MISRRIAPLAHYGPFVAGWALIVGPGFQLVTDHFAHETHPDGAQFSWVCTLALVSAGISVLLRKPWSRNFAAGTLAFVTFIGAISAVFHNTPWASALQPFFGNSIVALLLYLDEIFKEGPVAAAAPVSVRVPAPLVVQPSPVQTPPKEQYTLEKAFSFPHLKLQGKIVSISSERIEVRWYGEPDGIPLGAALHLRVLPHLTLRCHRRGFTVSNLDQFDLDGEPGLQFKLILAHQKELGLKPLFRAA